MNSLKRKAQNDPKDYDPILHKNEARPYENTRTRNFYIFDEILNLRDVFNQNFKKGERKIKTGQNDTEGGGFYFKKSITIDLNI